MISIRLSLLALIALLPWPCYTQSTECNADSIAACATYNRLCLTHFTNSEDCGYCLPGFIEINSVCYAIESFRTQPGIMDDLFTYLLEEYLPDFVTNATREERLERFLLMADVVSEWNVNASDFELGINGEAFLTSQEREKRLGVRNDLTYKGENSNARGDFGRFTASSRKLRDGDGRGLQQQASVDWHERGFTTRVKNQGLCGCCWAVSIAASIESALLITNQTLITDSDADSVSFQQMITCDKENLGCDGGNILYATRYAWEHNDFGNGNYGGLTSYKDYPFKDYWGIESQTCETAGKTPKVYLNYPKIVTSVNDRSSFEERRNLVMEAVSQQPITTTMKSQCNIISLYKNGVLTSDSGCECCEASCIDHAVVIVGYDTTASVPYWKVRNSWGPRWGEAGHFRVAMDDPGCGWGLFGILAESALMEDAYSTLDALPERPSFWESARGYQKALVIAGGVLGFICVASLVVGGWKTYKYKKSMNRRKETARDREQKKEASRYTDEAKNDGKNDFTISGTNNGNGGENNGVEITM